MQAAEGRYREAMVAIGNHDPEGPAWAIRRALQWDVPSAHNGWVELWLDIGIGGVVLFGIGFLGHLLALILARAMRRLHRALGPDLLDEFDALLAQDALHAADRVALAVQQMLDAAQQLGVFRTVIPPSAAALHRFDLAEARLPEPQNVLRQVEFVRDFADGTECVRRLAVQSRPLLSGVERDT